MNLVTSQRDNLMVLVRTSTLGVYDVIRDVTISASRHMKHSIGKDLGQIIIFPYLLVSVNLISTKSNQATRLQLHFEFYAPAE